MTKLNGWKMVAAAVVVGVATTSIALGQTINFIVLFDGTNGAFPDGSLIQGTDGHAYGTTSAGGANGSGTVFTIMPTGILTTLYSFCSQSGCPDGKTPEGAVIQAPDGKLYGTTLYGGAYQEGTVFKISAAGALTTLYSFCAQTNCTDGANPNGGLVVGNDGSLYGTTFGGGYSYNEDGTIFKITTEGQLTTLYRFSLSGVDGYYPINPLVQATDGDFYGTTSEGGAYSEGTVFKIAAGGALTTLHSFDAADGQNSYGALVQGIDGNFYGTTFYGGSSVCNDGCGTVFKMTPSGVITTIDPFDSKVVSHPQTGLIQATDGNFYGTTADGNLFEISPNGSFTVLGVTNGMIFGAGLVQATSGTFYGVTYTGGDSGCGSNTTCGTVFSLNTGLGRFIRLQQDLGKIGQTSGILGQGFTGTTGVSLNGTPASFTVVSDTFLKATIPAGATTGYVTVTTPSGTLTSNVPFTVIP